MDEPQDAGRSEVEAALRRSEERLRSIVESAVDGIITIDDRGLVQTFNPAAEHLFGYHAQRSGGTQRQYVDAEPGPRAARYLPVELPQHGPRQNHRHRTAVLGRRKNGTTFPLNLSVGEMVVEGKRNFTGILHDLSIRAAMDAALRKSEERLRSIVESAVDGIIVIDELGKVQSFNPAAERLFGYNANEVLGRNVKMLMPSPGKEEHDTYLERYLTTGRAQDHRHRARVTALRKDGGVSSASLGGRDGSRGRRHSTGLLHDLTQRVQLERRTKRWRNSARWRQSLRTVKNPIAGIRVRALQVITSRMPVEQRDRAVMVEIIARLDRLDRIVQDMLMFARPRALKQEPVTIDALVGETADLIRQDPGMADLNIRTSGAAAITGDRKCCNWCCRTS
jgi:two-component system sensor kinase FixL